VTCGKRPKLRRRPSCGFVRLRGAAARLGRRRSLASPCRPRRRGPLAAAIPTYSPPGVPLLNSGTGADVWSKFLIRQLLIPSTAVPFAIRQLSGHPRHSDNSDRVERTLASVRGPCSRRRSRPGTPWPLWPRQNRGRLACPGRRCVGGAGVISDGAIQREMRDEHSRREPPHSDGREPLHQAERDR
jgi:hypothetical protein